MDWVRETASPGETEALGAELARRLRPGDVVLLHGDLGAGKTVFARGLIHALPGGAGRVVRSPTFVYVIHHPTAPPVHHVDLYRLPPGEALGDIGLDELTAGEGITVIEWPRGLGPADFPRAFAVRLEPIGEGRRRVSVRGA